MEVYECDYDVNCSPLYKSIELAEDEEDYAIILYFLETGKWSETEIGAGTSPLIQAKTWVSRFDPKEKSKIKWSQLPLHLAIVSGAPAQIIASLVTVYPDALRCRDDQQMLPIHLALRYDASDDIVVYLLLKFPEAVNALAKQDRTSIECALKADDKVRGIMLDIFSEQAITKTTKILTKEKLDIQNELKVITMELADTMSKLKNSDIELNEANIKIGTLEQKIAQKEGSTFEMNQKYIEIESTLKEKLEKLQSEKLVMELEVQKALDESRVAGIEKGTALKIAREEITRLKDELDILHKRVADTKSQQDWDELKNEVEELKAFQLQRIRDDTKTSIMDLKVDIDKSIDNNYKKDENLKLEMKNEMNIIKKNLERLQRSESKAKTASEVSMIRTEIDALRDQLQDRAEAKKTKNELTLMKKSIEIELNNVDGKSNDEMNALRNAIDAHNWSDLESKTAKELADIKDEFNKLKKELKENEFQKKTMEEIIELKKTIEYEAMNKNDKQTKVELASMKTIVDNLQISLDNTKTSDEVVAIKHEIESLKEQLKHKGIASHIKLEVTLLKKMVETAELNQSHGKTQDELLQIKQSLKELASHNLEDKNMQELTNIKGELSSIKEDLKKVEMMSKTQMELENLKATMEQEIKNSNGKAVEELTIMKKALVALNIDHIQSKHMKKTLESEIHKANTKAEEELKQLKKEIDAIDLEKLELKNQDAWTDLHKEIDQLKAQMKQKQLDGMEQTNNELQVVKDAIANIDLVAVEKKRKMEYDEIKNEMDALKEQIYKKEREEKMMKKELDIVKKKMSNQKKRSSWGNQLAKLYSPFSMTAHKQNELQVRSIEKTTTQSDNRAIAVKANVITEDGIRTILPPGILRCVRDGGDESTMGNSSRDYEIRGRRSMASVKSASLSIRDSSSLLSSGASIKQMILELNASKHSEVLDDNINEFIHTPPMHYTSEMRDMPDAAQRRLLSSSTIIEEGTRKVPLSMRNVVSMELTATSSPKRRSTNMGKFFGRNKSKPSVSDDGAEVEISLEEVRE